MNAALLSKQAIRMQPLFNSIGNKSVIDLRIDEIATEFETRWRAGERWSIEQAMAANTDVPEEALLQELILVEIELRAGSDPEKLRSDFLRRFPRMAEVVNTKIRPPVRPADPAETIVGSSGDTRQESSAFEVTQLSNDRTSADEVTHHATAPTLRDFSPPVRIIGDYELLEQVGSGGMGIVYRARQKSLNRIVAVKILRAGVMAHSEDLQRFRQEAAAAAKLNHPNILPVHEFGEWKTPDSFAPILFLAMPYVDGENPRDRINRNTLQARTAAELLLKLANAVGHAHERQILHRDLKPHNVMLMSDGTPLVMDFGLACDLTSSEELTRTGQVLGTPAFMSKEQAIGGRVDGRSDIYSLGATLYFVLRGSAPFAGTSTEEILEKVKSRDPESPRSADPKIPKDIETICLKCLSKKPEERYQTAQELAGDLQLFLEGKPIKARPLPKLVKAWKWCRRSPWKAGLISLGVIYALSASGAAGLMNQLRKEERGARLVAEEALKDARDASIWAIEHKVRAQMIARDVMAQSAGTGEVIESLSWPAKSVDNDYIALEQAYSLPKVSNRAAGDWGYFDFRESPSGKQIATCDHSGVVQILNPENGQETRRLQSGAFHPKLRWNIHYAFFESADSNADANKLVAGLTRPPFTFSLDWLDEDSLVAVNDRKQVLRYRANPGNDAMEFVVSELPAVAHLIRVQSGSRNFLVALENGDLQLMNEAGHVLVTHAETDSRPVTCWHYDELNLWIAGFENGDVVLLNEELTVLCRLQLGSTIQELRLSQVDDAWMLDVASANSPVVRYQWNPIENTLSKLRVFDIPGRMYDHFVLALTGINDERRLFGRDNKGNLLEWNADNGDFQGMFAITQPANPWLSGMKATMRWPPILDRATAYLSVTPDRRLRAVDAMGVVMEFTTQRETKSTLWTPLGTRLGPDPALTAVVDKPHRFWALDTNGTLTQVDAIAGNVSLSVPDAHPGLVPSLETLLDGRLVTVSGDRTIRVWNTNGDRPVEIRRIEHSANLISLAVHPETHRIAAMDEHAVVTLWDSENGRSLMSASLPEIVMQRIQASNITSSNGDPGAATVDFANVNLRPYTGRTAFNLTGQYLAAFGPYQQFEVLDCNDDLRPVSVGLQTVGAQGGTAVCWSGTSPFRFVQADEYGTNPNWLSELEPASQVARLNGALAHGGYPADLKRTQDGGRIGLLMRDGRLMFATSEHFVTTILVDTGMRSAHSMAFGSNGKSILVAGRDGTLAATVLDSLPLPEETQTTQLQGTLHTLLEADEARFPSPGGLMIPKVNRQGSGVLPVLVMGAPRDRDGNLRLIRRRDNVWKLDPVVIPNSPGSNGTHVFAESTGLTWSKDDRPVIALRQVLSGIDGRLLLTAEQPDGSWQTEVVRDHGNEGHTCFPIVNASGTVDSILHFGYDSMRYIYSQRGPKTDNGWPSLDIVKGRGFRMSGFQIPDGDVCVCSRTIRGNGDYAPDVFAQFKPGNWLAAEEFPFEMEPAPGLVLQSLSDGTPVVQSINPAEAQYGQLSRRLNGKWQPWTMIPGPASDDRLVSTIHVTANDAIWVAEYRQSARRLYAWQFHDSQWTCHDVRVKLPGMVTGISCWIEENNRLVIVLTGGSQSEPGTIDVVDVLL